MTVKVLILVIIAELWNTAGQLCYKKGLNGMAAHDMATFGGIVSFVRDALSRAYVWLGLGAALTCILIWFLALAQADLSFVYPISSIQYVFILVGAHFFVGEKIDAHKVLGTALVIAGIVIISMT